MTIKNMTDIEGILVRTEISEIKFTCDLKKCKGACCTMESQYGAPIMKDEIKKLESLLPEILPFISEKKQK